MESDGRGGGNLMGDDDDQDACLIEEKKRKTSSTSRFVSFHFFTFCFGFENYSTLTLFL